ncbi:DUF2268 domain-containing putative Zn-dependent protease [Sphingomonas sp. dw_22]|uniref:DUF2268 domain-containing putative Zn-dependent protease n=1 Tax=Sphingomonas sp. dw_22 TaxID=2721175 RepID=UPI001C49FFD4|nr:DUF2268 domain-containing putative Zn-dependent protease [Sphingomonas sp. dw_22]
MHIRSALAALAFAAATPAAAQVAAPAETVQTGDVDRFWTAYDAIRAAQDPAQKLALVQSMYIDKGTPGLHALMAARRYTAQQYVDAIGNWPKFWTSVRPLTARALQAAAPLSRDIEKFRQLYPALKPASITYAVGVLRTGGTTTGNMVLIGAELALGDETVDVSELPEPLRTRLGTFFKSRPFANNGQNNVHEYVHTQQQDSGELLVGRIAMEGVAEFVAEQITGRRPALPLYTYGPAHEAEVRDRFRAEMDGDAWGNWLYNSADNAFGVSDMGYYVGYRIAQDYFARAADKKRAIKEMIELPYADAAAVKAYIARSGYLD